MASSPVESTKAISQRSHLRSLSAVNILSTGHFVPETVVSNADLGRLGYDSDWILQRTGIQSRRRLEEGSATSDMAIAAAQSCIESSSISPNEIDLIIVATMTPDTPVPSVACRVQDQLGLQAAAMDLNSACAGFMYGLVTGMQFVKAGSSNCALIVGADTNTRIVNPLDQKTFPLFGDGAGAVLIGPGSNQQGLLAYTLGAEGDGGPLLGIKAGGSRHPLTPEAMTKGEQFIHMDGRSVFKWAVRLLSDTVNDVLRHAELEIDDVDLVVLHQANARIIDAAGESLGIPREKMVSNVDRYGNTSAGSIPIGLAEAHQDGRISPGSLVLMCGFGAGLSWGTALMRW